MDSFNPQAVIAIFQDTITNHYFDMQGRVRRKTFWYFVLACVVVSIVAAIIGSILHTSLLGAVVGLGLLLPQAGMGARRLQDIGRPGTLVWALIIPQLIFQIVALMTAITGPFGALGFLAFYFTIGWIVNLVAVIALIAMIYFWVQPGTVGPNQYGEDPKGGTAPAAPATA
ncbi:MAG TPA: DUF805 domain-containing protein [Rhizomicrobium sp.]|jgi:uncharacterized membrane protein YhaH (DUF805 family)|nr:DUF805 domain-containing protein [Rhizomicrobium sp.]